MGKALNLNVITEPFYGPGSRLGLTPHFISSNPTDICLTKQMTE